MEKFIGFPGKAFASLREDQQRYVSHLMQSWHAADDNTCWYEWRKLRKAIRKARNNLP